jgi:hypothetical protein
MSLPDVNRFGPPFSPLVNSPFNVDVGGYIPSGPSNFFLLMDATDFLLQDGSFFLLMN